MGLVRELRLAYVAVPADDLETRPQFTRPADAAAFFAEFIGSEPVECFAILLLDTKHRSIGALSVTRGTLDTCLVDPRAVFAPALVGSAAGIITAHNHPSGDVAPSPDDLQLFARLSQAGEVLGVPILDHLILGHGGRYYSACESSTLFLTPPRKD